MAKVTPLARSEARDAGAEARSESDVAAVRCTWQKKLDEGAVGRATEQAVAALVAGGIAVREITPVKSSLEELFGELTLSRSPAEPPEQAEK